MKVTNVRINGVKEPIGFDFDSFVVSWNVEWTESTLQTSAKIEVGADPGFNKIVYAKSGSDMVQGGTILALSLAPRTSYYLRVTVTGEKGDSGVSDIVRFETGKIKELWRADWISPAAEDTFHPVMRKTFLVGKPVKRARFYGTGVGLFELHLNGEKVGNEFLTPYVTNYEQGIQTITFALDGKLKPENTLEIYLAKGWYMGVFGLDLKANNFGSRMAAIGELYLEYRDGTIECIKTDETWEYRGSDVEDSGIYDGEILNRTLWQGKENPWKPVELLSFPELENATRNLGKRRLRDRLSLPVIVKETIKPVEIIKTPAGETVLDFGQNFAGFMSFHSRLPKGTKIKCEVGEILQQGNFYHANYRDAVSEFVYISDGREEQVHPHFTYYGFRYVKVTGWPGELKKEDFLGNVIYSDLDRTGYIETANSKVNRLYQNVVWGQKSNFIDMPTDCPQRSERLGWTGDTQVFAPTASYNMDTRAFYHKFIRDLLDEQKVLDGGVPNYVPNIGSLSECGAVWGDIATLLPNTLWNFYGNKKEAEYDYSLMKDWVDYIRRQDVKRGETFIVDFGFCFGDWLGLDGATPSSFKGGTDDSYISTIYYMRSAQIVSEIARQLGKEDDARNYATLARRIREAALKEFFTPNGRLVIDTQAGYVAALKFSVYVDKEKLIEGFKSRLKRDMNQIKCGFVGAPLLCTTLAENGMYETAYDFLLKEGFPGWMYAVDLGATTIWERWNSVLPDGTINPAGMNSLNHYSYGSVMEFVYAYAAGLRSDGPGFKKAVIEPHPDIRVPAIKCRYRSVSGTYVVNWKIDKTGKFIIHIEVPFNCTATVLLPESGLDALKLAAGSYDYSYTPKKDLRKPYGPDTTLARLSKDPAAVKAISEIAPPLGGMIMSGDPEMGANTVRDLYFMTGFLPLTKSQIDAVCEKVLNLIVEPVGLDTLKF